jgi:hypothetical protein
MKPEWIGTNKKGLAIVRISSRRQEGNISHETQENEIREYCRENGIVLKEVIRIVESAKDSEDRKKYAQAVARALAEDIGHLLFYMYDRESRNLTDNEKNEKLVKAGLLCLHYVRENKVLHKDSPDSEFFIRDVQAAANKQFIRNLSAKVIDAMRAKAESGWYPSNNVPLGYALEKSKDDQGKEMRRGSIVVADPDKKRIKWVQREFELRARGLSFEQIRLKCIEEGFVEAKDLATYRRAAIEKRIHNQFYNGMFHWQGQDYEGKHERIISAVLFADAQIERRGLRLIRTDAEHGVFSGGWMRCALCECTIVYDPKTKLNRRTGEKKTFHYYHCSNGKRLHINQRGMNIPESKLWEQFDRAVDLISVSDELADAIAKGMNEDHRRAVATASDIIKRQKGTLQAITEREDRAYDDMIAGTLDQEGFKRQVQRLREERNRVSLFIQEAQRQIHGGYRENIQSVLELAKSAKSLYVSRSPWEKRDFLERILSNPVLEGSSVRYQLRKPFNTLSIINQSGEWRAQLDNLRTDCSVLHKEGSRGKRASGK